MTRIFFQGNSRRQSSLETTSRSRIGLFSIYFPLVSMQVPHIQRLLIAACLILTAGLAGCSLGTRIQGEHYLKTSAFDKGIESFSAKVEQDAEDGYANYYLGRFLLAEEEFEKAYPYLERATRLEDDNAEFFFWRGVAQWSLGLSDEERLSYQKALSLDPDHLEAHVYLGHNSLDRKDFHTALAQYEAALELFEHHPDALYNKGLALEKLDRTKAAIDTWKIYLKHYPDGVLGRSAIQYLNAHGDFSYRLHALGIRRVPLEWIRFQPGTAELTWEAYPSLRTVGAFMTQNISSRLTVQSFYTGSQSMAEARGQSIKKYFRESFRSIAPERISVQSYGRPERIMAGGTMFALDSSIVFKASHDFGQE